MKESTIVLLLALIVLGGGGWYFQSSSMLPKPSHVDCHQLYAYCTNNMDGATANNHNMVQNKPPPSLQMHGDQHSTPANVNLGKHLFDGLWIRDESINPDKNAVYGVTSRRGVGNMDYMDYIDLAGGANSRGGYS